MEKDGDMFFRTLEMQLILYKQIGVGDMAKIYQDYFANYWKQTKWQMTFFLKKNKTL